MNVDKKMNELKYDQESVGDFVFLLLISHEAEHTFQDEADFHVKRFDEEKMQYEKNETQEANLQWGDRQMEIDADKKGFSILEQYIRWEKN